MAIAGKISTYIRGSLFEGLKEISITTSLKSLCGSFSFSYDPTKLFTLPNGRSGPLPPTSSNSQQPAIQDTCEFYIDGNKIFTGYIEDVRGSYNKSSHEVSFTGRSKTLEIVDHTITVGKSYLTPPLAVLTYKQFFNDVLKDSGLTNQTVVFDPSFPKLESALFKEGERAVTEPGQSVFSVLDTYAKKINAILITDPEGNLLVTQGNKLRFLGNLNNKVGSSIGAASNNILEASFKVKTSNRFSKYTLISQLDTTVSTGAALPIDTSATATQIASAEDSEIKRTKEIVKIVGNVTGEATLQDIADWYVNLAKTQGSSYTCKVFDYYTNSRKSSIWEINKMVKVDDDFSLTTGNFLIDSITYIKSIKGTFTQLTVVNQDSYSNRQYENVIGAGVAGTIASNTA